MWCCHVLILVYFEEGFSETCFENCQQMINSTILHNKTALTVEPLVGKKVSRHLFWCIWQHLDAHKSCILLNFS